MLTMADVDSISVPPYPQDHQVQGLFANVERATLMILALIRNLEIQLVKVSQLLKYNIFYDTDLSANSTQGLVL